MKTVSLELAKELKLNGYPQESYFWWINWGNEEWKLLYGKANLEWEHIAAPTAEEILEKLPKWVRTKKCHYNLTIDWLGDGVACDYSNNNKVLDMIREKENRQQDKYLCRQEGESLIEAAAKMWLYLKKNNLL